jgi:hypothetical protein
MFAAANEQDMLCRIFGDCLAGDDLDREIGDVIGDSSRGPAQEKLFSYARATTPTSTAAASPPRASAISTRPRCRRWIRPTA